MSSFISDSSSGLSMQQQFQLISAGAAAHQKDILAGTETSQLDIVAAGVVATQAHKLATPQHTQNKVSLLTIVSGLAGKPADLHQATALKPLPSNLGELQQRSDSWENAQHKLEQQVASQKKLLEKSAADEYKANEDMVAVQVFQKRKVIGCAAFSIAIAILFISAMSQTKNKHSSKQPVPLHKEYSGMAEEKLEKKPLQAAATVEEPVVVSEMSSLLADLAGLIGKVNMPSQGSSEVAMEAMEAKSANSTTIATEGPTPVVDP